ncbi:MAG TPA: HEPN domain-containing protein [Alphaproteobacteria bacterium]|nr:HEPN domain-containing protein [Alphaproteobacteria bacterium]
MGAESAAAWFAKAQNDIAMIRNGLLGPMPSAEGAAFHCQQAVEKLLKGVLAADDRIAARTHDIAELLRQLGADHPLAAAFAPLDHLTVFAVQFRYPAMIGDEPDPPTPEAVTAWLGAIEALKLAVDRYIRTTDDPP